ncbi:Endocytosis and vacuole integrity protein [Elasticomyces elasticus]|nr:Endocytosis and vacuole integrity protein [Elasticomyces elasticus]
MTSQLLTLELSSLINEAKRKNTDLRNAAEKSLQDLKSLRTTSEQQLAAAAKSRNARFASSGVSCLQRLIISKGLPKVRLADVLDAFSDASGLSHDVQLKILQTLPTLLQVYTDEIRGSLLASTLQICSALHASRNPAVSGVANATLQQLLNSAFEKVANEDRRAQEVPLVTEVPLEDGKIAVRAAAFDAYRVFRDLCLCTEGHVQTFVKLSTLAQTSALELIDSVLRTYSKLLIEHLEFRDILRTLTTPLLVRLLSENQGFAITVRVFRAMLEVLRSHMSNAVAECETALDRLLRMLEQGHVPGWKRTLAMELFRELFAYPGWTILAYELYDDVEGSACIIQDLVSVFARMSTEKPALIGLGRNSTMPSTPQQSNDSHFEEAAIEAAGGIAGAIGSVAESGQAALSQIGISTQWSSVRTPCIDQLDKADPPVLPETYIYSLCLVCTTSFANELASASRNLAREQSGLEEVGDSGLKHRGISSPAVASAQVLSKNGTLPRSSSYRDDSENTKTSATLSAGDRTNATVIHLVEGCWPALLATCSTYLYSSLDSEYYRELVKALQRLAHVAGLLGLSTPRDAFMTSLAKAAMPIKAAAPPFSPPQSRGPDTPNLFTGAKGILSADRLTGGLQRRPSEDIHVPLASGRNLLCLRALLNLAIAIGPSLGSSYLIVLQALRQSDVSLSSNTSTFAGPRSAQSTPRIGSEASTQVATADAEAVAVQTAVDRLFQSTTKYTDESFVDLLAILRNMLPVPQAQAHGAAEGPPIDDVWVLSKLFQLAKINTTRLSGPNSDSTGWTILAEALIATAASRDCLIHIRRTAANIIRQLALDILISVSTKEAKIQSNVQRRSLSCLYDEIGALYSGSDGQEKFTAADVEIHGMTLEGVRLIVETCGEAIVDGWDVVLHTVATAFDISDNLPPPREVGVPQSRLITPQLGRVTFEAVQLICSDFLSSLSMKSIGSLVDVLWLFAAQPDDLNTSLTVVTLFWNVSDFLVSTVDTAAADSSSWLFLLLRLASVSQDKRAEVRNGAVRTLMRILDVHGGGLTPTAFETCLDSVLFLALDRHADLRHNSVQLEAFPSTLDEVVDWDGTTKILLDGTSQLLISHWAALEEAPDLPDLWGHLAHTFERFLDCESYEISTAVFAAYTVLVGRMAQNLKLWMPAVRRSAALWLKAIPESRHTNALNNQTAFTAYVGMFNALYPLMKDELETSYIRTAAQHLLQCVKRSSSPNYTTDVNQPTPLQVLVHKSFQEIDAVGTEIPSIIISSLAELVALPFSDLVPQPSATSKTHKQGLTFVAASKMSTETLESKVLEHANEVAIYETGALLSALDSLTKVIKSQYVLQPGDKGQPPWQKAISAALAIAEPTLTMLRKSTLDERLANQLWLSFTDIADGIARADCGAVENRATVRDDEDFDMASLLRFQGLIIPSLGEPSISADVRHSYVTSIFEASLLHKPQPGEIPATKALSSPLSNLLGIRRGRVKDPAPAGRLRMAYFCFEELVSLVRSVEDGSPARFALARAAAPYLILRLALPLKMYLADQPLRGRMPQPWSQLQELLFCLETMRDLRCTVGAVPSPEDGFTIAEEKAHLVWLYPLVVQALTVAGNARHGDADVLTALRDVLGECGGRWRC